MIEKERSVGRVQGRLRIAIIGCKSCSEVEPIRFVGKDIVWREKHIIDGSEDVNVFLSHEHVKLLVGVQERDKEDQEV